MPNNVVVKYLWAPLRALLRKLPERDVLLVLSLVVGLFCGAAAVLLKLAIHYLQTFLLCVVNKYLSLILQAVHFAVLITRQPVI